MKNRTPALLLLLLCLKVQAQEFPGLDEAVASGDYGDINALLVSQHGELVFEGYYRGKTAGQLNMVHSVTKSIGATLVGIAHRQGRISLDTTMGEVFAGVYHMPTEFPDKAGLRVESVLQQRHGVRWDEWSVDYLSAQNPVYLSIISGDWYGYFFAQGQLQPQGRNFAYSTPASNLMSRMVRYASGKSPEDFMKEELLTPLGITQYHWELYSDQGLGHGSTDWSNSDDDPPLGFALWLRAPDMLKIGQMYLNGGVWEGQRILDQEWIDKSWTAYSNHENTPYFTNPGSGYGYQWWLSRLTDDHGRAWPMYYANGWGRQYILVVPALDMVLVSVADDYQYDGPGIGALLRSFIMPQLNMGLDSRFNGSWRDPAISGQGFNFEILEDQQQLIGYWYNWDEQGQQRWHLIQGPIEGGAAEVTIYQAEGGIFLLPDPVQLSAWGTGRIETVDCGRMQFDFNIGNGEESMPLTRLTGSCE